MKINKYGNYKENTIKFFDKMASKNHGDSHKHYKNVIKWCNELEFHNFLDLGTGRGDLIQIFRDNFKNKEFKAYGIDISENMIKKASLKGINAQFSVGDSENIQFEDNSFDLITCINSFHHYENSEKSIKEIGRVLQKEGVLILGEIYVPLGLEKLINKFLPYGTTGDYKIYSSLELKEMFKKENLYLEKESFVFPSIKTYMFRKK